MPSTRKPKKKAPRRVSRSAPWHQALEHEIVTQVIQPTLARILQAGVQSRRDLHAQWQATTGCTVSSETFSRWLRVTGYDALFSQVRLVTAPLDLQMKVERELISKLIEPVAAGARQPPPTKGPFCAFHQMHYNDPNHQPTQECLVNEEGVPENDESKPYTPPERALTLDKLAGVFPLPVSKGPGPTVIPAFNAGAI